LVLGLGFICNLLISETFARVAKELDVALEKE